VTDYLCATCGTLYPPLAAPPAACPICLDERQFVPNGGQRWTTLDRLRAEGHRNSFREEEPGLVAIGTVPEFAIGWRAFLVRTREGNLLWDPVPYLDPLTVEIVRGLGGVRAIAVSHPHFFGSMALWAEAFGATIHLHESALPWVMRPSSALRPFAADEEPLFGGLRVVRLGGHFACSSVLLWPEGASGRGVLLTGDTITVVADRRFVTFLYSYPNRVPLPAADVAHIRQAVEGLAFDRLYGGWVGEDIPAQARESVLRSADRYLRVLAGEARAERPSASPGEDGP
jgi:hypothetical protein